jgi:hypothetical protein
MKGRYVFWGIVGLVGWFWFWIFLYNNFDETMIVGYWMIMIMFNIIAYLGLYTVLDQRNLGYLMPHILFIKYILRPFNKFLDKTFKI